MKFLNLFLIGTLLVSGSLESALDNDEKSLYIVSREQWGAKPPLHVSIMNTPVEYVVVHHTNTSICLSSSDCEKTLQSLQNEHMLDNGWADIGYSFAVGGNGLSYEARGWNRIGAHTEGYNDRSIGIYAIGTFKTSSPPNTQSVAIRELIEYGVSIGKISNKYRLIGHRQAVSTDCPGEALYNIIKTWPHWVTSPTHEDLLD